MAGPGGDAAGQLVARLRRMAGRALGRAPPPTARSATGAQARWPRRRELCPRRLSRDRAAAAPGEGLLPPEVPADRWWLGRPLAELRWHSSSRASWSTRSSTAAACREGRAPGGAGSRVPRRRLHAARHAGLAAADRLPPLHLRLRRERRLLEPRARARRAAGRRGPWPPRQQGRADRPQPRRALRASARGAHPDRISHAISLGADLRRMLGISLPTRCSWQERGRGSSGAGGRTPTSASPRTAAAPSRATTCKPFPEREVRLTTIYSKGDGVVRWEGCVRSLRGGGGGARQPRRPGLQPQRLPGDRGSARAAGALMTDATAHARGR